MSSIKFDSKANTNTKDVLNMTMQWGYRPAAVSKKPEPISSENEALSVVLKTLTPVFNFVSMIAGSATAIAIIAYIAWWTRMP